MIVLTSPLSAFLRIGRADLLVTLLRELHITEGVEAELERGRKHFGNWRTALPDIHVHKLEPTALLSLLLLELHQGEAESIALAVQEQGKLVIDEIAGRQVAERLGVSIAGSAGLVKLAKMRGVIPAARPVLDELRQRGGLWLSEGLYRGMLASLGEE